MKASSTGAMGVLDASSCQRLRTTAGIISYKILFGSNTVLTVAVTANRPNCCDLKKVSKALNCSAPDSSVPSRVTVHFRRRNIASSVFAMDI